MTSSELIIFVNGAKVCVRNADPECTLAKFLRNERNLKGTKLGCAQGGCGACTVMISRYDKKEGRVFHYAANACLLPIVLLHGQAVTTIEGVGSTKSKMHPIQTKLAVSNGTQCGFCSPGMIMSMYALLRNEPHPTQEQIENCLVGNLCRCTGYRPILDGFQSFAKDGVCAMGDECCKNKEANSSSGAVVSSSSSDNECSQDPIFPPELKLKDYLLEEMCFEGERVRLYKPVTLSRLLQLMSEFPEARIVCGNTSIGVGRKLKDDPHRVVIAASHIPELRVVDRSDASSLRVGASITFSELESILQDEMKKQPASKARLFRTLFSEVLKWFASTQIKNVASLAGNLLMENAMSDFLPLCIAAGVSVTLTSAGGSRVVVLDEGMFANGSQSLLRKGEIIQDIVFPLSSATQYYAAFKQATRKSLDTAFINAGMKVDFDPKLQTVAGMSLIFGGLEPLRAKGFHTASQALIGRHWDDSLMEEGVKLLSEELTKIYPATDGSEMFKKTLVLSFWFKFYVSVKEWLAASQSGGDLGPISSLNVVRSPSQRVSTQGYEESPEAVGDSWKASHHRSAKLHTTGEAQYVDDLSSYGDELHMALVCSTEAHANITSIETVNALSVSGVRGFISADDIPGAKFWGFIKDEPVFSQQKVLCVGQIIGAVVADTRDHAKIAAAKVKIEYEKLPAILTIEEAVSAKSFYEPAKLSKGDALNALSEAEFTHEGSMKVGGQDHFYMESQVSLCVPQENGEMVIQSSTQVPHQMQMVVSEVLNVPSNKITVRVKRLGGGFGGKQFRSLLVSLPAAVAAHKFGVPVRCSLDRDEDMLITGGRGSLQAKYKVGYNKQGRLHALDIELYSDAGCTFDISMIVMQKALFCIDNAYNIPHINAMGWVCKMNTPSNTACRGLAGPQAILVMEQILIEISDKLGLSMQQIHRVNLYKDGDFTAIGQAVVNCNLEKCYNQVLHDSNYDARLQEVKKFNSENRWKKRGIALTPTKYGICFDPMFLNQANAVVHIYTDGNVLLTHGGTELGQGIDTKIIQVASNALGLSSDKIYIQEMSTNTIPNSSITGASTNTDLDASAIQLACEELNRRLEPFKLAIPDGPWEAWIGAAYLNRVSLSAQGFYATPDLVAMDWETGRGSPFAYYVYGAAVSEVEVDCLTGDHQVLRTDIVMDAGRSLNPAIDIGQIEGAFVQGYGLFCLEQIKFDEHGRNLFSGPRDYKIPVVSNIPREFNVSLLKGVVNKKATHSSKAQGEPPLFLSASVFFAIKAAISAARKDSGSSADFPFNSPCLPEVIRMACGDRFTKPAQ